MFIPVKKNRQCAQQCIISDDLTENKHYLSRNWLVNPLEKLPVSIASDLDL